MVVTRVINASGNEECCQGRGENSVTSSVAGDWNAFVSDIEPLAN